jgi:hypothetical protein
LGEAGRWSDVRNGEDEAIKAGIGGESFELTFAAVAGNGVAPGIAVISARDRKYETGATAIRTIRLGAGWRFADRPT